MSERYFAEQPICGDRATLAGSEAHHLLHVMRAKTGSQVVLFDGGGDEFHCVVDRVGRDRVELRVVLRAAADRELPFALSIAAALPKGERQKWLVEKCVELGVTRLVPLRTQRSVALPGDGALQRLRRTVIEASKQCGRNRLMLLEEPRSWPDLVARSSAASIRLFAHPGSEQTIAQILAEHHNVDTAVQSCEVLAAVGPEGGLSDEEVASAIAAGWRMVGLGERILRVETAAIAMSAAIASHFHGLPRGRE